MLISMLAWLVLKLVSMLTWLNVLDAQGDLFLHEVFLLQVFLFNTIIIFLVEIGLCFPLFWLFARILWSPSPFVFSTSI
jgi:hypothetical protein